jgi:NodT family efflux transporter outer membrane factor (OMF) lipoprotein
MMSRLYFLLIIGLISGCAVGPGYIPPSKAVPSSWNNGAKQPLLKSNTHAWWRHFHDPILNNLIEQQANKSFTIKKAQARVRAARAEYDVAYAQFFPKINANLLPPDATNTGLSQLLALTASIEPDFFGKRREDRNRTAASLQAEQADKEYSLFNLQAEIASSYLMLREAQTKNNFLQNNINSNKQFLSFLKERYKAGFVNFIDLAQQEALIDTQSSELEQNKILSMMSLHKIEMLTGNNPGLLVKQLHPSRPVPQMTQPIHLGIPSDLLRHRSDIIAAERRVAAAHANIRIATANLFPQITLGWLIGWQSRSLTSNLFAIQNSTLLGTFDAPLLNLTLHRIVDLRKREKALAVIHYQLTVLKALHDVERHYQYYQHSQKSALYLKHALKQKKLVLKLAKDRFKKESLNFDTVLKAEEESNLIEMTYLHQVVNEQIAKINLYKAIGGRLLTDISAK